MKDRLRHPTGRTKDGTIVIVGKTYPCEGGWLSYAVNSRGVAVEIFIPGR